MSEPTRLRPLKEAARITQMLDLVLGANRFDRAPVDVIRLALEYSRQIAPDSPIHEVVERNIPGCVGALVYGEARPRQWAIMYHAGQSDGRRSFTVGHEFAHYLLHRQLIEQDRCFDSGIYCDENSVDRRAGVGIEQEADEFTAALLMPLHDFRRQQPAKARVDFDKLSLLAKRYGVSLTAAVLRWLEYTETRAMMVVSNEGFAHWAKPSDPALKSGRFIRTKNTVYELPSQAFAARRDYSDAALTGVVQQAGVWFPEPVHEICLRSDRYDQEITVLQFEADSPRFQAEEEENDVFDLFVRNGQAPDR
ncbi:ImmA/IrrE family metallo-endopeptidase [Pinisolibacter sp. B13]|uniref:ImmA/IrrE family metallo-endopeptidase n=1 Tax=Pinisolibacter aquiterrae TaxID=2815579 RepID=UPI001C3E0C36|nr:ImmA/IrrE family metallo-endopeptidase [Pinisolibacter aquiterrae]MBV5262629.1 ImmA/IrrE family metallo-endopeptidase [Pinisolibacter aquiterrae]